MASIKPSLLLICLILCLSSVTVYGKCPDQCRCSLDGKGRRKVICQNGGMRDSIPISDISSDTQILVITAPPYKQNYLSLGPIFKGFRNLEEVHIKYSAVPNIGAHSFWGLKELRVLNLTRNSLSTLMDTNFKGINALRHLDLSYNHIESVPSAVFRYVRHLHSLSLANNRIETLVTRIFFGLTRLEHLDLSHNPLGVIQPELFSDIPVLKKFSCAGCKLNEVSGDTLMMVPEVKDLDLRNNYLLEIPDGLLTLTNLMSLKLDGNQISHVAEYTFTDSPVTHVFLSHNSITNIELGAFINSSISHLDISYNRLSDLVSGGFSDVLSTIRDLQISGNPLQTDQLFELLQQAHQLHHLGMGDIGLSEVPNVIGHGRGLHSLNLSSNFLSNIPREIFISSPKLRLLDLSNNEFEGINVDVLDAMSLSKELRILRLENNPWQCDDCHVAPLLQWLQHSPDQESGCSESKVWTCLRCVGPKGLKDQPLSLLPMGDLPKCVILPTKASPSMRQPSSKTVIDTEPLTDEASREYVDILDELKVGPPLADQPVYARDGFSGNVQSSDTDNSDLVTVGLGVLALLLIIGSISAACILIYRKKSVLQHVIERTGEIKLVPLRVFKKKESETETEINDLSKEKEMTNETNLDACEESDKTQQTTEIKGLDDSFDDKISINSENISAIIRETVLL